MNRVGDFQIGKTSEFKTTATTTTERSSSVFILFPPFWRPQENHIFLN